MDNLELRTTGENLMTAIAYGDAAGVPVETKSYRYIEQKYDRIIQLIPTTDNLYFEGTWPEGKTSDDTAASADIARALIRADGFDLETIADEHIRTFLATPDVRVMRGGVEKVKKLGYGASTSNSMWRLIDGASPYESGEPGGTGNGVIMKMAPLVYWQYARSLSDRERYEQYDQLTTMTHDSDVARIATRVHGDVLYNLLLEDYVDRQFGYRALKLADLHETHFGNNNFDSSKNIEIVHKHETPHEAQIHAAYVERSKNVSDTKFGKSYGFYVPETLAIAYTAFRVGGGDYAKTVYSAVNMGGDADSTASISGAMVNFMRKGNQTMPADIEKVQDVEALQILSHQLADVALRTIG